MTKVTNFFFLEPVDLLIILKTQNGCPPPICYVKNNVGITALILIYPQKKRGTLWANTAFEIKMVLGKLIFSAKDQSFRNIL